MAERGLRMKKRERDKQKQDRRRRCRQPEGERRDVMLGYSVAVEVRRVLEGGVVNGVIEQ